MHLHVRPSPPQAPSSNYRVAAPAAAPSLPAGTRSPARGFRAFLPRSPGTGHGAPRHRVPRPPAPPACAAPPTGPHTPCGSAPSGALQPHRCAGNRGQPQHPCGCSTAPLRSFLAARDNPHPVLPAPDYCPGAQAAAAPPSDKTARAENGRCTIVDMSNPVRARSVLNKREREVQLARRMGATLKL